MSGDIDMAEDDDGWDIAKARAAIGLEEDLDQSKAARQKRQKKLSKAVSKAAKDGRSLRATGRTEHLNFKAKPAVKKALQQHVGRGEISLWLEKAIISRLLADGIEIDLEDRDA